MTQDPPAVQVFTLVGPPCVVPVIVQYHHSRPARQVKQPAQQLLKAAGGATGGGTGVHGGPRAGGLVSEERYSRMLKTCMHGHVHTYMGFRYNATHFKSAPLRPGVPTHLQGLAMTLRGPGHDIKLHCTFQDLATTSHCIAHFRAWPRHCMEAGPYGLHMGTCKTHRRPGVLSGSPHAVSAQLVADARAAAFAYKRIHTKSSFLAHTREA